MRLGIRMAVIGCLALPVIAFAQDDGGSPQTSTGDNTACWSYSTSQEVSPQITCAQLTTELLTKLRFATAKQIEAIMKEPGEGSDANEGTIRYVSNYDRGNGSGSGSVDFTFNSARKVVIIDALIDVRSQFGSTGTAEYLWNADRKFFCSDIPDGVPACN